MCECVNVCVVKALLVRSDLKSDEHREREREREGERGWEGV